MDDDHAPTLSLANAFSSDKKKQLDKAQAASLRPRQIAIFSTV